MNVVHLTRRFVPEDWGGTETVILETARRMLSRDIIRKCCVPMATASENEDHIQGLRVRRYGYFYPYWGLSSKARGQLDRKGGNVFFFFPA